VKFTRRGAYLPVGIYEFGDLTFANWAATAKVRSDPYLPVATGSFPQSRIFQLYPRPLSDKHTEPRLFWRNRHGTARTHPRLLRPMRESPRPIFPIPIVGPFPTPAFLTENCASGVHVTQ
jgi:hypothetical protein